MILLRIKLLYVLDSSKRNAMFASSNKVFEAPFDRIPVSLDRVCQNLTDLSKKVSQIIKYMKLPTASASLYGIAFISFFFESVCGHMARESLMLLSVGVPTGYALRWLKWSRTLVAYFWWMKMDRFFTIAYNGPPQEVLCFT
ncbi:unnamed protein product [Phytophthora fragariaefolia]|uniref:Unnamed protein product n=1 Tax=Phytophthora fragariaefolia TaxID=1490495 RepID=A0A9W6XXZ4_9STRA|nr:unnamed protein product [Phytophthora fragariaefolia]